MLHSWIIEEIEKEEERRRRQDRPVLEIPISPPTDGWQSPEHADRTREEKSERGVAIIDLGFASSDPPSDF
jgi:hypothetical protein